MLLFFVCLFFCAGVTDRTFLEKDFLFSLLFYLFLVKTIDYEPLHGTHEIKINNFV